MLKSKISWGTMLAVLLASLPISSSTATGQEGAQELSDTKEVDREKASTTAEKVTSDKKEDGWKDLLPEKGLEGWKVTDFGGEATAKRDGKSVVLEMGDPLNGITYQKKDFPTGNYELYVEAKRLEGSDFLCGLTFPIGDEYCSFIAGGWGGTLVGLSSVDGADASENSTTTYHEFENDKWYRFKLRVDDEYVTAWIDDEKFFYLERDDHEFSTRIEVYACEPLGYCAYQSKVALRNFRWRPIASEKQAGDDKKASTVGAVDRVDQ